MKIGENTSEYSKCMLPTNFKHDKYLKSAVRRMKIALQNKRWMAIRILFAFTILIVTIMQKYEFKTSLQNSGTKILSQSRLLDECWWLWWWLPMKSVMFSIADIGYCACVRLLLAWSLNVTVIVKYMVNTNNQKRFDKISNCVNPIHLTKSVNLKYVLISVSSDMFRFRFW